LSDPRDYADNIKERTPLRRGKAGRSPPSRHNPGLGIMAVCEQMAIQVHPEAPFVPLAKPDEGPVHPA
jgi:hypothetical protein